MTLHVILHTNVLICFSLLVAYTNGKLHPTNAYNPVKRYLGLIKNPHTNYTTGRDIDNKMVR